MHLAVCLLRLCHHTLHILHEIWGRHHAATHGLRSEVLSTCVSMRAQRILNKDLSSVPVLEANLCFGLTPLGAYGQSGSSGVITPRQQQQGFAALRERMEIISPADIKLVKFLGAGGYGEVSSKARVCWTHALQSEDISTTGSGAIPTLHDM